MNIEEFEKVDKVMRVLWKKKASAFTTTEIAEITGFSFEEVDEIIQLPLSDYNVISPYKSGDINTVYQISDKGYRYFARTNYVEEFQRLNNVNSQPANITNNFNGIHNSTIINNSTFTSAFNKINKSNTDLAKALEQLKTIIDSSGKTEAIDLFDSINEEIVKEQPRKSVLKGLWTGLLETLPAIKTAGEIYGQISGFIG